MNPQPMLNTGYKPPVNVPVLESSAPTTPFPATCITDITPFKLDAANIYMQGQIPDCVENGVCFAKRYKAWKATGKITNPCRRELAIRTVANDGVPFLDGTSLDSALTVGFSQGIGDAQYFADDHTLSVDAFIGAPIPAIEIASDEKIPPFTFLNDLSANGLKSAVAQHGIVLIGIKVSDWWWTAPNGATSWAMNDILPIRPPDATHPEVSGHCVAIYGYDTEYFYFINWWSSEWGDKGHGWFGVNDLPFIYEAAVISDYPTAVTPPAPTVVIQEPSLAQKIEVVAEDVVEMGKELLAKIEHSL